ncbi:hypothetical protein EON66_03825, partial [archaeon]
MQRERFERATLIVLSNVTHTPWLCASLVQERVVAHALLSFGKLWTASCHDGITFRDAQLADVAAHLLQPSERIPIESCKLLVTSLHVALRCSCSRLAAERKAHSDGTGGAPRSSAATHTLSALGLILPSALWLTHVADRCCAVGAASTSTVEEAAGTLAAVRVTEEAARAIALWAHAQQAATHDLLWTLAKEQDAMGEHAAAVALRVSAVEWLLRTVRVQQAMSAHHQDIPNSERSQPVRWSTLAEVFAHATTALRLVLVQYSKRAAAVRGLDTLAASSADVMPLAAASLRAALCAAGVHYSLDPSRGVLTNVAPARTDDSAMLALLSTVAGAFVSLTAASGVSSLLACFNESVADACRERTLSEPSAAALGALLYLSAAHSLLSMHAPALMSWHTACETQSIAELWRAAEEVQRAALFHVGAAVAMCIDFASAALRACSSSSSSSSSVAVCASTALATPRPARGTRSEAGEALSPALRIMLIQTFTVIVDAMQSAPFAMLPSHVLVLSQAAAALRPDAPRSVDENDGSTYTGDLTNELNTSISTCSRACTTVRRRPLGEDAVEAENALRACSASVSKKISFQTPAPRRAHSRLEGLTGVPEADTATDALSSMSIRGGAVDDRKTDCQAGAAAASRVGDSVPSTPVVARN